MYLFCLFLIASQTSFINKSDFSDDLAIFMISFISSFETFNVVIPDPSIFWWITSSLVDAAAVYPNGIKTHLANILSTFFIKDNPPRIYLEILLIVLFYTTEFLIILY